MAAGDAGAHPDMTDGERTIILALIELLDLWDWSKGPPPLTHNQYDDLRLMLDVERGGDKISELATKRLRQIARIHEDKLAPEVRMMITLKFGVRSRRKPFRLTPPRQRADP